jgi:hypothetical protein
MKSGDISSAKGAASAVSGVLKERISGASNISSYQAPQTHPLFPTVVSRAALVLTLHLR